MECTHFQLLHSKFCIFDLGPLGVGIAWGGAGGWNTTTEGDSRDNQACGGHSGSGGKEKCGYDRVEEMFYEF